VQAQPESAFSGFCLHKNWRAARLQAGKDALLQLWVSSLIVQAAGLKTRHLPLVLAAGLVGQALGASDSAQHQDRQQPAGVASAAADGLLPVELDNQELIQHHPS